MTEAARTVLVFRKRLLPAGDADAFGTAITELRARLRRTGPRLMRTRSG